MSSEVSLSLKLKVFTPDSLLADEDVQEISLPGVEGYLGILPGHCPILVALGMGKLSYRWLHREESFFIKGGYAEVLPDRVIVFSRINKDNDGKLYEG